MNTLPNGYTLKGVYFCSAAKNDDWIELRVDAKTIVVPSLLLDSIARFLMHKQNMTFEKQSDGTITISYYEYPLPEQTKNVMEQYFNHKCNGMFRITGGTIYYFERGGKTYLRVIELVRLKARPVIININDQTDKKLIWIKDARRIRARRLEKRDATQLG